MSKPSLTAVEEIETRVEDTAISPESKHFPGIFVKGNADDRLHCHLEQLGLGFVEDWKDACDYPWIRRHKMELVCGAEEEVEVPAGELVEVLRPNSDQGFPLVAPAVDFAVRLGYLSVR